MNVFGERQHPEKFIPKVIKAVMSGESISIHSSSDCTTPGSRFWIHARNVASAVMFLLINPTIKIRDKYNIVGEAEVNNLEMAQTIAEILDRPLNYEMVDFHSSRPGHDLRYALDGEKLKQLGHYHPKTFKESLKKTIEWYLDPDNIRWLGEDYVFTGCES